MFESLLSSGRDVRILVGEEPGGMPPDQAVLSQVANKIRPHWGGLHGTTVHSRPTAEAMLTLYDRHHCFGEITGSMGGNGEADDLCTRVVDGDHEG